MKLRRVGARSMPAMTTSRRSALRSSESTSHDTATSTAGPSSTDDTNTVASVRRSRSASTSSLRHTAIASRSDATSAPLVKRAVLIGGADVAVGQGYDRRLEVVGPRAGEQLRDGALGHRATRRDDHDAVAQALHLLHDVGREHDALRAACRSAQGTE